MCWVNGKCIGNLLIIEQNIPTSSQCLELCQDNNKCYWITYNENDFTCSLWEDCETLDEIEEELYVSSESRCQFELESTTTSISTTTTETIKGI